MNLLFEAYKFIRETLFKTVLWIFFLPDFNIDHILSAQSMNDKNMHVIEMVKMTSNGHTIRKKNGFGNIFPH